MAAAAFWQTRLGVSERYLSGTGFTFGIAILLSIFCGPDLLGNCSQKKGSRRSFQLAGSDVKEYTMRFAKKCYIANHLQAVASRFITSQHQCRCLQRLFDHWR